MRTFYVFFLLLFATSYVFTQDNNGNPANWCRNGSFPSDTSTFRVGTVTSAAGEKLHFLDDSDDCPNANDAKCVLKTYLVAGNTVLISRSFKGFVCSWYQPAKGHETVGWLAAAGLNITDAEANPKPGDWIGNWVAYDDSLKIKLMQGAGTLSVHGDATWRGQAGNVNIGEVNASAGPAGNKLILVDDPCHLSLSLVGGFIIASDDANCGGHNVRFDGVYRRKP